MRQKNQRTEYPGHLPFLEEIKKFRLLKGQIQPRAIPCPATLRLTTGPPMYCAQTSGGVEALETTGHDVHEQDLPVHPQIQLHSPNIDPGFTMILDKRVMQPVCRRYAYSHQAQKVVPNPLGPTSRPHTLKHTPQMRRSSHGQKESG